jgi:hypothetical protein
MWHCLALELSYLKELKIFELKINFLTLIFKNQLYLGRLSWARRALVEFRGKVRVKRDSKIRDAFVFLDLEHSTFGNRRVCGPSDGHV